jgi:hypothetical protein
MARVTVMNLNEKSSGFAFLLVFEGERVMVEVFLAEF